MRHITGWGLYWILWFVVGFGIPELYGLIRNAQDTLSRQFWGLEHIDFPHPFEFADWTPAHWLIGTILFAFIVWLGGHMIFGIWR